MRDFIIDMFLRSYTVVGVNKNKIEDKARIRELRRKFKEFCDEYGVFETIEAYFKEGQKAEIFVSIYVPAWFDGCDARPLKRGGRELRKADIIEMRTPKNGVFMNGKRID